MKLKENFELQGTDNVQGQIHTYPSILVCHMEVTVFNILKIFLQHMEQNVCHLSFLFTAESRDVHSSKVLQISISFGSRYIKQCNTQWCTTDKAASQGMEITILNYLMNKSGLNFCLPVQSHSHLIAIF